MKRCIPSLLVLLAPLAPAFREEVFETVPDRRCCMARNRISLSRYSLMLLSLFAETPISRE